MAVGRYYRDSWPHGIPIFGVLPAVVVVILSKIVFNVDVAVFSLLLRFEIWHEVAQ